MFSIELKYAVQIVAELERARHERRPVTTTDVRRRCGYEIMTFNNVMFFLTRSKWIDNVDCPALLVDLEGKSLFDLAEAINDPAVNEHDYMYGWSSDSLRGDSKVVDISRQLSEDYRSRLIGIPLASIMTGLKGTARKNTIKKRQKFELVCRIREKRGGTVKPLNYLSDVK